ncbi:MAG: hypothetical protein ACOYLH_01515 [Flavobacteriales bacterium]|jgi:hypothetical protein
MNQKSLQSKINVIAILTLIVAVYNLFYWTGKFYPGIVPAFVSSFYNDVKENWGLLIFLEFLAVASLFVDLIANFDSQSKRAKFIRIVISAFFLIAFVARFLIGMIDKYMDGSVR